MKSRNLFGMTIIACLICAANLPASDGPVDRGAFIIAGSISYSGFYEDKDDLYNIQISPEFHYFLYSQFSLGADIFVDYWKDGNQSTTRIGIGPSVGYYLRTSNPRGFPFARAAVFYTYVKAKAKYFYEYSEDDSDIRFKGSIGYTYLLSKNIAIAGSLDYAYEREFLLYYSLQTGWRQVLGISVGLKGFVY